MEIQKMLVLSTGNLTEKTCNVFMPKAEASFYEKKEYGWFAYVTDDREGLPADLVDCLELAQEAGASWIMFDQDADAAPGLPYYEW
jgi:hypothetical protein